MVFIGGAFRGWLGHESRAHTNGICALIKEPPKISLALSTNEGRKKRWLSRNQDVYLTRHWINWCFGLGVPSLNYWENCPGLCGSVGWASFCKLQGCWFNSRSGHMPGLQVSSPVGVCEGGNQSMFLSHVIVSLPLFLPPFPPL